MKNLLFTLLFSVVFFINIAAQGKLLTESEDDLYWQPERKIEFSDYQSKTDTSCIKFNIKYGMQMSSNIGFRGIVDIPKKRGKIDKGYIVPVFCKKYSCILSEDSLGLKVDRLYLDVAEVFARRVRIELENIQKADNIDNPNAMFFTTVKNQYEENMRAYFGQIGRDVFIDKKENAYEDWRKTVDESLETTKKYATKPEDCYRFVLGKPVEKGYEQAKTIMGDMRQKE